MSTPNWSKGILQTMTPRFRFFPSFLCFHERPIEFSYQEKEMVKIIKLSTCSIIHIYKKYIYRSKNYCQTVYKKKKQCYFECFCMIWLVAETAVCFFGHADKICPLLSLLTPLDHFAFSSLAFPTLFLNYIFTNGLSIPCLVIQLLYQLTKIVIFLII